MRPFRFDRTWRFDVPVDELWSALSATEQYRHWWPWLRDLDTGPLTIGTVARFRVQPPLPYSMRFMATLVEVVEGQVVVARVSGDVSGDATLSLSPTAGGGSSARLQWVLHIRRPSLARVAPVVRPVMVLGHDVVVTLGARQFRRRALGRR